ncbi:Ubiquitin-conjugating enzyme E2 K [Frankliniella fusca]|uniref:Ubiquitin-conjugating enzyme E2 K n=1 Tax=Frankliniella fusca TaxID=407009 RepID=A0AAE1H8Z2_9NEOP|nr:Ubiquitin-conjugating enzyme E2 K [Frankliniella fusca]
MATDLRTRRIMNDLKDFNEGLNGIILTSAEDLSVLEVALAGPPDTPFETGTFNIEITIPRRFPFSSPTMTFTTKVWHPNISKRGRICMDVLDRNWNSGITLIECAEAARALLNDPNPDSPLNVDAANLLEENKNMYELNAKLWTRIYAGGSLSAVELEERLSVLIALGLNEEEAALKGAESRWNIQSIIEACNL